MSEKKKGGKTSGKAKVVSFLQNTNLLSSSQLTASSSSSQQLPPLSTESSSFTFVDDKGKPIETATQIQLEEEMSLETEDSLLSASDKMIVDHHSSKPEMSLVRLHNFLETAEVKKRM